MNWSDVGNTLKTIAGDALPILGGALGGPLGSEVGTMAAKVLGVANTPNAVNEALKTDPQAAEKLAQIESDEKVKLAQIAAQAVAQQAESKASIIEAINKTIQSEAIGRSWLQRNAQAVCKISTVGCVVAIYFVLPLAHIAVPPIPGDVWLMLGGILGVTAWHDGRAKTVTAQAIAQKQNS